MRPPTSSSDSVPFQPLLPCDPVPTAPPMVCPSSAGHEARVNPLDARARRREYSVTPGSTTTLHDPSPVLSETYERRDDSATSRR
eukprot:scaffold30751_cov25-Tisochrysis_lutea.AAC.3